MYCFKMMRTEIMQCALLHYFSIVYEEKYLFLTTFIDRLNIPFPYHPHRDWITYLCAIYA